GEIFIALEGDKYNGVNFISEAFSKGALAAVVNKAATSEFKACLLKVDDSLVAFGKIAKEYRQRFNIPIISVTGSNGKTTTKDMISCILGYKFRVLSTCRNENNLIGVPKTLFRLKEEEFAVLEVGTDRPGEIGCLSDIIKPKIGVITNIGHSHLEGLADIDGVLREKTEMLEHISNDGVWVRNLDDELLSVFDFNSREQLTFSIEREDADFFASNISQLAEGIEFDLIVSGKGGARFFLPMLGRHNVCNALAAITACSRYVGIDEMVDAFGSFEPAPMRMQLLNKKNIRIIDDTYNANPLSLRKAVLTLKSLPTQGRRVLVCGDMLQLGGFSEILHREAGRFIASQGLDLLVTIGLQVDFLSNSALHNGMDKRRVNHFKSKTETVDFLCKTIVAEDVLLFKGSRAMKMEDVIECFINSFTP
ncbi:MAG: UDP-N-acetylmuramoyl-tripeptide--D-alanyl-D-alanine ligase, partial [Candidatus Omnitrophota bacterium]